MRITIIGLGWFGMALGEKLAGQHIVQGTKTSAERARAVSVPGILAFPLLLDPQILSDHVNLLAKADCLVINIPPGRKNADPEFYNIQMQALYEAFAYAGIAHLIFISSTSVFGDSQFDTDEDTVPQPTTLSGKILLQAEKFWIDHFPGRISIIRPGGLVGEDRHPARSLSGKLGITGKYHPVNLVHRIDLVNLTEYIIENKVNRTIFHAVAQDHPKKMEYYTHATEKFQLALPHFDETDSSIGRTTHAVKTRRETGIQFHYNDPYDMF